MKYFLFLFVLFLVVFAGCSASASTTDIPSEKTKESTCPRGLENDEFPGSCRLYVDENADHVCDYSETYG